jgi:hypothetical protein
MVSYKTRTIGKLLCIIKGWSHLEQEDEVVLLKLSPLCVPLDIKTDVFRRFQRQSGWIKEVKVSRYFNLLGVDTFRWATCILKVVRYFIKFPRLLAMPML